MNLESQVSPELWSAVYLSYQGGNYTAAIQDAIYLLSDALRAKSGLEADGSALVGQALGGNDPLIKITRLQSESEWNVQRGMEQLLRGLYQAIRNPRSHGKVTDTENDAQTLILFVDYILRIIGASRAPFSLPEYIGTVLDKDFVASARYSELLVEKLPRKYLLEVFHETFRRRHEANGEKLRTYYSALMPVLTPEEREEVSRTVSGALETASEESDIRTVIDVLGAAIWKDIDELARLRIENKLIDSVRGGSYNLSKKRCDSGAFGTWTTSILENCVSKKELGAVLIRKLELGGPEEREYVYTFFFSFFDSLYAKPPKRLEDLVIKLLSEGDARFKEAIDKSGLWCDESWSGSVEESLASFVPREPAFGEVDGYDDGLPF